MAEDTRSPAEYAADIGAARDRLISFAGRCTGEQWRSAPLDGDPRPVGVVVDHVADAYEYLAGWIRQLVAGQRPEVSNQVVDGLNAKHATAAAGITKDDAAGHLRVSGAAISELVGGLDAADLEIESGRVRLFAQIAVRHADYHRKDIEAALAAPGAQGG
jgi:hypothetical protein